MRIIEHQYKELGEFTRNKLGLAGFSTGEGAGTCCQKSENEVK